MVVIIMAIIAFIVEDSDAVKNFTDHNCRAGTANCTVMTLTRLHNVEPPSFGMVQFEFSYDYCCDFDGNIPFCGNDTIDSNITMNEEIGFRSAWQWDPTRQYNETTGDYNCSEANTRTFDVSSSEMFS